jgi:Mrp family chromosome partitioning ATPase
VVNAAGGVTPAPTSSFASLERTLERTVDTLVKGEPSAEAKALLIEARRLRSIVANWRSIPPPTDVYDEMLERVLALSTSAGAALYDPGPSSVRSELEPRRTAAREPSLYDDFEQTERTEIDPSSRRDLEPPSRRDLEPPSRRDLEPPSRRNFEPPRRDLEPPSRRNFEPPSYGDRGEAFSAAEVPAADDERTIQESPYYPPVHGPYERRASAGTTGRRAPEFDPSFLSEDDEATSPSGPGSVRSADFAPPRHGRPLMASNTGTRPAEPLRTGSGMSPRGRALGTRSGMPAFSSSHSLDDPPEYPAFDSPAYGDDAPSYPSYDLNAAARQQLASNAAARADAAAAAARSLAAPPQVQATLAPAPMPTRAPSPMPARVPSPMPVRVQSSPMLLRSAYPDAVPDDRPRSRFPSEGMGFEVEAALEETPIAPATSVTVHPAQIGEKIDPNIVLLSDAHSDRADAYRALRRKLASSGNPQVIAITSSDAAEGKTTCALNLALAMRETSHGRVLVIEANGRSPAIARLLGIATPECFYDQLASRREDPRKPWVAVEVMPKLHLMTVDPSIKRAPQLEPLSFAHGMARLKLAGYEYILLDTPPVLGTFEVNLIADNVTGVLFTAITMKSKRSHLRKAIEQIMPATVLGVMVLDS